jgi:hypothetical protein
LLPTLSAAAKRDAHQLPANAEILVRRANRQRPKQMIRKWLPAKNWRHPHRGDDFAMVGADKGQPPVMRALFPTRSDERGRTGPGRMLLR